MPKGRTRRSSGGDNLPYNAFTPYPSNTLHPRQEAKALATAMSAELSKLATSPIFGLPSMLHDSDLHDDLWVIASRYYIERFNYDQDSVFRVKNEAQRTKEIVEQLGARISSPTMKTAISRHRGVRGPESSAVYSSVVAALTTIIGACDLVAAIDPSPSGTRSRDHVRRAIAGLVRVWEQVSEKKFPKSVDLKVETADGQTFRAVSSEFVFRLAKAMDPQLTPEDIQTAIKKLPVTKRRLA